MSAKPWFRKSLAVCVAGLALSACGGGGDGGGPAPTNNSADIQGVYGGTFNGSSTSSAFQMLVLESGEYWAMYGVQTASTFYIAGFIQGNGVASAGTFTSSNTRDFGVIPAVSGNITATYNVAAHTIAGTVSAGGQAVSFSGGPIPGSLYNYDAPASLSTVAGTWTLTDLSGSPLSLSVTNNGAFTANASGCAFSGNITPRASGKNVFNVGLTFGAAPCALAGQNASGIAVAYPLANGTTQLLVAVTDGTRAYGTAAFGAR